MPAELLGWSLSYFEREKAARNGESGATEKLEALRFAVGENSQSQPKILTVQEPEISSVADTSLSAYVVACANGQEVHVAQTRWNSRTSSSTGILLILGVKGSPLEGVLDAFVSDPRTGEIARPAGFQLMPSTRRVNFEHVQDTHGYAGTMQEEGTTEQQAHSRTEGALGAATLGRLRRLQVAVVGVSRTGSLLVESLMRGYGVRNITLIDGDVLEPHNLREASSLFPSEGVGQNKAQLLQRVLEQQYRTSTVRSVPAMLSPGAPATVRALSNADLIVTCTDTEGSVLFANALACAYGALHLDIGTGVLPTPDGDVKIGADVRLLLPGVMNGCALCFGGGIADQDTLEDAIRATQEADSLSPRDDPDAWRQQRAGSLLSINQLATSLGCRLVEDVVREKTTRSCHVHFEGVASDEVTATYIRPNAPADCLCQYHGAGDYGIRAITSLLGGTCFN
jgi:molybdopterin/thiamine biosynthesis adenylyltransferase